MTAGQHGDNPARKPIECLATLDQKLLVRVENQSDAVKSIIRGSRRPWQTLQHWICATA
jgi:hypothetical protein